jgi:hypothetical protein
MPEQFVGLSKPQANRIVSGIKKIEAIPQGNVPNTAFRPGYGIIAHGVLTADLNGSTATMDVWWYNSGETSSPSESLTVQSWGSAVIPSGASVWAVYSRGNWYAMPISEKFHGVLSETLERDGTADAEIYSGGSGTGVTVTVQGFLVPTSKNIPSGSRVSFYLDSGDGLFYADASDTCPEDDEV